MRAAVPCQLLTSNCRERSRNVGALCLRTRGLSYARSDSWLCLRQSLVTVNSKVELGWASKLAGSTWRCTPNGCNTRTP
jgi:hypothetical protein